MTDQQTTSIKLGDRVRYRGTSDIGRVVRVESCGGVIVRWFPTLNDPDGCYGGGYYHRVALEKVEDRP